MGCVTGDLLIDGQARRSWLPRARETAANQAATTAMAAVDFDQYIELRACRGRHLGYAGLPHVA